MATQEAIEIITNIVQGDGTQLTVEQDEALAIAQKAIKKQIAKKPIADGNDNTDNILCPSCRNPVGVVDDVYNENSLNKFCYHCGQALEWS